MWLEHRTCKARPHRSCRDVASRLILKHARDEIQLNPMAICAVRPRRLTHAGPTLGIKAVVENHHDSRFGNKLQDQFDVPPDAFGGVIAVDKHKSDCTWARVEFSHNLRQQFQRIAGSERDV